MKRFIRWFIAGILLLPFLMTTVLYLPPVQQWATDTASHWLSNHIGYTLTIERLRLRFPLRIHAYGITLTHNTDTIGTIANIHTQLSPHHLLQRHLYLPLLTIEGTTLHANTLFNGIRLDGTMQNINIQDITYNGYHHTLQIQDISLHQGKLSIVQYASSHDSSEFASSFPLSLIVDKLQSNDLSLSYATPSASLHTIVPYLTLDTLTIDTLSSLTLQRITLQDGTLQLSPHHSSAHTSSLTHISLQADSLRYIPQSLQGTISKFTLQESHGFTLQETALAFHLSQNTVVLPYFTFRTSSSTLHGYLYAAEHSDDKWKIHGNTNASIGYTELQHFSYLFPDTFHDFLSLYPQETLTLNLEFHGSTDTLNISHCQLTLPTVFEASMNGQLGRAPHSIQLELSAMTHDIDFLVQSLDTSIQRRLTIPHNMHHEGLFHYTPDTLSAELTTSFAGGSIFFRGGYRPSLHRYDFALYTDNLNMQHILPSDTLGRITLQAHLHGEGYPLNRLPHQADISLRVDSLVWTGHSYSHAYLRASLHEKELQVLGSYADSLVHLQLQGRASYSDTQFCAQLHTHLYDANLQRMGFTDSEIRSSFQSQLFLSADSSHTYTLSAHLYDMKFTTPKHTAHPQSIRLRAFLTPDTLALSIRSGDLLLSANAHTTGLPWQWHRSLSPFSSSSPHSITQLCVMLQAGPDNPVSNYLALTGATVSTLSARLYGDNNHLRGEATAGTFTFKGMSADTTTITARYTSGTLHLQLSAQAFQWHTAMMQLDGSLVTTATWNNAFRSDSLQGIVLLSDIRYTLPLYSLELQTQDTLRLPFSQGTLHLIDIPLYAAGKQPLLLHGTATLLDTPSLQLQLYARDVALLHQSSMPGAQLFGLLSVDGTATLSGPFHALRLTGDLTIRGTSSLRYIYKNASLTSGNSLDDVVTFTNFTAPHTSEPSFRQPYRLGNFTMNLTVTIEPTAQIDIQLGSSTENTCSLQGGGSLNIQYIPATGLRLSGKYTVSAGTLQINIPLLHVHALTIRSGSTVQWSGNALNPLLDITAENRIRTSVTIDDTPQSILFVTSISLSETMEHLGLQFNLSAPENASMQNTLATLSPEERSKLAVALLTTGLYLGEGGTGNLMNSALLGFLQSQLDNISRDTFRSVDVSFGIDPLNDGVNGTNTRTDYTFTIAKRFWHDRIRIVIGGSLTTDNERIQDDAIIDKLSVEWRITPNGSQYLRFFYDKNYENILEGEIRETGAGYIFRKQF